MIRDNPSHLDVNDPNYYVYLEDRLLGLFILWSRDLVTLPDMKVDINRDLDFVSKLIRMVRSGFDYEDVVETTMLITDRDNIMSQWKVMMYLKSWRDMYDEGDVDVDLLGTEKKRSVAAQMGLELG